MSELTIREMENGEEFAEWFSDLTLREEQETGDSVHLEERFLVLSNEIGIGLEASGTLCGVGLPISSTSRLPRRNGTMVTLTCWWMPSRPAPGSPVLTWRNSGPTTCETRAS
jgi:hypothetical protein